MCGLCSKFERINWCRYRRRYVFRADTQTDRHTLKWFYICPISCIALDRQLNLSYRITKRNRLQQTHCFLSSCRIGANSPAVVHRISCRVAQLRSPGVILSWQRACPVVASLPTGAANYIRYPPPNIQPPTMSVISHTKAVYAVMRNFCWKSFLSFALIFVRDLYLWVCVKCGRLAAVQGNKEYICIYQQRITPDT